MSKAVLLRTEWEELTEQNPQTVCNHPKFERETYLENYTLDYVCTTCGKLFYKNEMEEFLKLENRIK